MKELYSALSKAQAKYKPAHKSGVNTYFNNSKYPTLNDFIDATVEALSENGLSVSQDIETRLDGTYWINSTLAHASGESKTSSIKIIMAKNDMQSLGSATTYGRRYAYAAIVGIAPEDDDGNNASGKEGNTPPPPENPPYVPKPKQTPSDNTRINQVYSLAKKAGWTEAQLKDVLAFTFNAKSVNQLNDNQFQTLNQIFKDNKSVDQAKSTPAEVCK